jgi:hypothetical protein
MALSLDAVAPAPLGAGEHVVLALAREGCAVGSGGHRPKQLVASGGKDGFQGQVVGAQGALLHILIIGSRNQDVKEQVSWQGTS